MANVDVLPYDYEEYGKEIGAYINAARKKSESKFAGRVADFTAAVDAAKHFQEAGAKILSRQKAPASADLTKLNRVLRDTESALLISQGLPNRPWYRHVIYAPGQYTGYAAVVIPGVNEAIDAGDLDRVREQIAVLASALQRASKVLESYR
jgi:N-acetylated-alpha-linked acidic dipeptidase